jgi:hypothetical protein
LGFNARDTIRGVATTSAALGTAPKDKLLAQPLAFFIVGGEKDPEFPAISNSAKQLRDKKFPVIFHPIKDFGKEYLSQTVLLDLCVWIDTLDRI